jgi:hypothetical protein
MNASEDEGDEFDTVDEPAKPNPPANSPPPTETADQEPCQEDLYQTLLPEDLSESTEEPSDPYETWNEE